MTYCLGIVTKAGLVMASDSRTNAGYDQVNTTRKMYTFVTPGEHVFCLLASGNLSLTQSVMSLLRRDYDLGYGLAKAPSLYDAARVVGEQIRRVDAQDRPALERDEFKFNVNILLGGQVKGEKPGLMLVYPQGNFVQATDDSPYLQIGETKYGRPILDRGIKYDRTSLEEASKYALLSMDSTMKSNVTVGPPIDVLVYATDELDVTRHRRFAADDPDLQKIRVRWEQALRQAILRLPEVRFKKKAGAAHHPAEDTIQLVEHTPTEAAVAAVGELQAQQQAPAGPELRAGPGGRAGGEGGTAQSSRRPPRGA
jgi:putative proteasome-type protease